MEENFVTAAGRRETKQQQRGREERKGEGGGRKRASEKVGGRKMGVKTSFTHHYLLPYLLTD